MPQSTTLLWSIAVDNGGSGYTSAPTVTISGGGGGGATADAIIDDVVASIAVDDGGSGYTTQHLQ